MLTIIDILKLAEPVFNILQSTQDTQALREFGSALVGALVGGGLSIIATVYSIKRTKEMERTRFRRALIGEIQSIEVKELHILAQELSSEGAIDKVMEDELEMIVDTAEVVNDAFPGLIDVPDISELKKESISLILPKLTEVNMSSPVFDSNVDKIGTLRTEESKEIIQFYRYLDAVKIDITKAVESYQVEKSDDSKRLDNAEAVIGGYNFHIQQLNEDIERLAEQKKECMNALNADEFIEVDDTYKAVPSDE